MEESVSNIIQVYAESLKIENAARLRENVDKIEKECLLRIDDVVQEEILRHLWLSLVRVSVDLNNIQLSKLIVSRLKLTQLESLLEFITENSDSTYNKKIALHYVANHFQMNCSLQFDNVGAIDASRIFDQDEMIEFYISCGNWLGALEQVERGFKDMHQAELRKRLIYKKLGKHQEVDEKFKEALTNYEKSGTENHNSLRVIIKDLMGSAGKMLQQYCSTSEDLQYFWAKYSLASGRFDHAIKYYESRNELISSMRCAFVKNADQQENMITEKLPDKLKKFILSRDQKVWFDRGKLDFIQSIATTLDPMMRSSLVELALHYSNRGAILKTCNIYICLNLTDGLLMESEGVIDKLSSIQLLQERSSASLVDLLMSYLGHTSCDKSRKQHRRESKVLFASYLKLGLIDEALQIFANDADRDEMSMAHAVELLEGLINERHRGFLDNCDPELKQTTTLSLYKSLDDNQGLITNVINVVILSTAIFLIKLDINDMRLIRNSVPKLEYMFDYLSRSLIELSFIASDALVRSMNILVAAVKDKLDILSDSEIIRESFRNLVETMAAQCMIESRYKSAAMLYSQIEDNVNAVKSLMRTGETETVINYALLVHDVTVNRLTINYLKYLEVDPEVIEDFIARADQ